MYVRSLNPGPARSTMPQQKYIKLNLKKILIHFAHYSSKFHKGRGSKSVVFGLDFLSQPPLTHSGFERNQHVEVKHSSGSATIDLRFDWDIRTSSSNFYTVKRCKLWPKFDTWGAIVLKRRNKSKIWNRCESNTNWPIFSWNLIQIPRLSEVSDTKLLPEKRAGENVLNLSARTAASQRKYRVGQKTDHF